MFTSIAGRAVVVTGATRGIGKGIARVFAGAGARVLVVGRVVLHNSAAAVHGPKHSAAKGKTRMPSREEAKALLAAIPTDSLVGLRDRVLIGTLLFTFARVGAATAMRVEDYYPVGRRMWVRLHEKGGRFHEMPVHHTL